MKILPFVIQLISIVGSLIFMYMIFRLIIRGKLREEYAFIWILCTFTLLLFAVWRDGIEIIAHMLGVFYAPSIIFIAAIFVIIVFLVHLSVVNSKQQHQIKGLSQKLAILQEEIERKEKKSEKES